MRTYRESEGASGAGAAEFVSAELVAPDHGIDAGWRRAGGDALARRSVRLDQDAARPARCGGSCSTFLGPGYLVAVGYMDPGNWATSLAGGSKFGYALLSIALLSNLMAIMLQALCVRLGIASRPRPRAGLPRRLPALCRRSALGARRVRHLRHRSGRGDRHGDRAQSPVRHSARDRRAAHRARRVSDPVDAAARLPLGRGVRRRLFLVITVCFGIQIAMADPDWGQVIRGFAPTVEIVKNPDDALSRARHHRRDGDAA